MFASATALRAAQTSPVVNVVQGAREPLAKTAALEALRRRNTVLDAMFYDVGGIGHEEAVALSPWLAAEGAILVVPPTGAGAIAVFNSVDGFVAGAGPRITQLAVAGVGSSALGSAAFARNVADATGQPVAAVVSGYGLADLATEALGGFFWFGILNGIRHELQAFDRLAGTESTDTAAAPANGTLLIRTSRDTQTVLALLLDERLNFSLLTGHSKGNLVLSEALYELVRVRPGRAQALAAAARIVTVSALIEMPRPFRDIVDVIGAWDWFGGLNSRSGIGADVVVPRAWHHTNTEMSFHLPVMSTLKEIIGR